MSGAFFGVAYVYALVALSQGAVGGLGDLRLDGLQVGCRLGFKRGIESIEAVVLCDGRPALHLAAPDSLQGLVNLDTPERALEYVRLFTTERRWTYAGMRRFAEPRVSSRPFAEGFLVSAKRFRACCQAPTVEMEGTSPKKYRVTRTLVDTNYKVFRVVELVDEDGRYTIHSKQLLRVDGRRLGRWSEGAFPELSERPPAQGRGVRHPPPDGVD